MKHQNYFKRRPRRKRKTIFTGRNIVSLILLSLAAYGAFRYWVDGYDAALCDGAPCESTYSIAAAAIGFFLMFLAVIGAGAVIGFLIAYIRSHRTPQPSPYLSANPDKETDQPD